MHVCAYYATILSSEEPITLAYMHTAAQRWSAAVFHICERGGMAAAQQKNHKDGEKANQRGPMQYEVLRINNTLKSLFNSRSFCTLAR